MGVKQKWKWLVETSDALVYIKSCNQDGNQIYSITNLSL